MDINDKKQILKRSCVVSKKLDHKLIDNLNESQIEDICQKININESSWDFLSEAGVAGNIFGILLTTPMTWLAWRTALALFSKNQRKCGVFTISNKRDICIIESKIKLEEDKIKILNKEKQNASKEGNQKKVERIDKAIQKARNNIDKLKKKADVIKKSRGTIED